MSKSLVKLVDNSLLPAAIMIIGKFLGIVITIKIFDLPWSIKEYTNNIFSFTTVVEAGDLSTVTSYSDLIMYFLIALFFTATIIRAVYLHSSHIKPTLVTHLANRNLLTLIQNSYEIYHSAVIWLLFTWIANVLIIVNAFTGKSFGWVAIATSLTSVLLTVVLLQDVYREVENIKHNPGQYQWKQA